MVVPTPHCKTKIGERYFDLFIIMSLKKSMSTKVYLTKKTFFQQILFINENIF